MAIPALVTAAASALIPIVADLFRARGSKTSTRNADTIEAAAPALIAIAKEIVPNANEQAVTERILADKALQEQFRAAVALKWSDVEPFLTYDSEERQKARDFATGLMSEGPQWRQVGAGVLVGTLSIFIVVGGGLLFWDMMYNPNLDPGQKGLILGALIAAFTTAVGFWFGSSRSAQIKDMTIAEQAKR